MSIASKSKLSFHDSQLNTTASWTLDIATMPKTITTPKWSEKINYMSSKHTGKRMKESIRISVMIMPTGGTQGYLLHKGNCTMIVQKIAEQCTSASRVSHT